MPPVFKKIKIQPEPGGGLTFADTGYNSISGKINTSWEYGNNYFALKVNIPFNTTAEVCLMKKYGTLIQPNPEYIYTECEDKYKFNIGSGEYMFTLKR